MIKRQVNSLLNEGNNEGLIGQQTLDIIDNSLTIINQKLTTVIIISKLNKVVEDDRYVFVYSTSINALIIPKTYLSDEDKDELIKIINDKITS
ncbi:MAG: YcxB family protein [Candidatus Kapabacteria bacterium]|nr:YcxB family protein [Ignavibacteriota bacterium]MCW5885619.1 YcxB family protein [Candidatus Kapabacteria bacterium]